MSEQLDRTEAATQKRLEDDPAYQEQLHKAHTADAIAKHAEAKTDHAENDRVEKSRPYEADPLFMYLWNRGYGTADYAAIPVEEVERTIDAIDDRVQGAACRGNTS
jgi:hypothetical protein